MVRWFPTLPSDSTKLISDFVPPLIAHAWTTPQHVSRVDTPFDAQKPWVVGAPEGLLEVRLVRIGLEGQRLASLREGRGVLCLVNIGTRVGRELPQGFGILVGQEILCLMARGFVQWRPYCLNYCKRKDLSFGTAMGSFPHAWGSEFCAAY